MLVNGIFVQVGQTIAFDYARRTKSGVASRIGVIDRIDPINGNIIIRETVANGDQYRAFKAAGMVNVLAE